MNIEMPLRDEVVAQQRFSQRSKYYLSQSAKTWLKDCFDLNTPTVLDPGHTTMSLSVDQNVQFARTGGLKTHWLLTGSWKIFCYVLVELAVWVVLENLEGFFPRFDWFHSS